VASALAKQQGVQQFTPALLDRCDAPQVLLPPLSPAQEDPVHNVTTSRHTRSASELFLMVPIKPGFVPISDVVMTYATRVSTVLSALYELRQRKLELDIGVPTGPIELLQTIHRVEWTVFETHDELRNALPDIRPDFWTQIKGPQLVLTSHYTGSLDHYFYDLASIGGPLLDLIFSHTVGYDGNSCDAGNGYEAFSRFIRRHQRPCNFLYAAEPDLTVDDLRYSKALLPTLAPGRGAQSSTARVARIRDEARALQKGIRETAGLPIPASWASVASTPKLDLWSPSRRDWTQNILNAVQALFDIKERLFSGEPELRRTDGRVSTGSELYEDAVYSILEYEPDADRLEAAAAAATAMASGAGISLPPPPAAAVWVHKLIAGRRNAVAVPSPVPAIDKSAVLPEVQQNIVDGVNYTTSGALLLLHCADRDALSSLIARMANEPSLWPSGGLGADQSFINFALTFVGIKRAELGEDVLEQFPREFWEGMEERAGSLGDIGAFNHPRFWQAPLRDDTGTTVPAPVERIHLSAIDAVVVVHAVDASARDHAVDGFVDSLKGSDTEVLHRSNLQREALDPFKLVDKVSQPKPRFSAQGSGSGDDTALGEFLLGYPDRNGRTAACALDSRNPTSSALFQNSTFLVLRQMKQDKSAFDAYVEVIAKELNVTPDVATSFILGRKPNGALRAPLQDAAGQAIPLSSNEFDFKSDPEGAVCPVHAHVRRSNPRVEGTPRILRRGYSYGPDAREGNEEGSMFMAYNASIAEQYEVLQRYVNDANSTGLSSAQNDPLCGANGPTGMPRWVSPSGKGGDFVRLPDRPADKPLVVLRWGLYTFVPSKSGLRWLAETLARGATVPNLQDDVARGMRRMQELDALPGDLAQHEWKRLLEEVPEAGSAQARLTDDVFAAIRHAGGVKRVSETLVVVTGEAAAREVLGNDGSTFSVVEYGKRMSATIQKDHYLAHDVVPTSPQVPSYAELSQIPNQELDTVTLDAFAEAFAACSAILSAPEDLQQELPRGKRNSVSLRDLARAVVGKLCKTWFGMPEAPPLPPPAPPGTYAPIIATLEDYLLTSRYTFQYEPGAHLKADATNKGKAPSGQYDPRPGCPFATHLIDAKYAPPGGNTAALMRQAVTGAVVGFAPPTVGAVIRVLDQWIEDEQFWRLRLEMKSIVGNTRAQKPDRLKAADERAKDLRAQVGVWRQERAELNQAIYSALGLTPSPPILYRTALKPVRLSGVDIQPNAKVVIALSSVYADARALGSGTPPEAWLFGGEHSDRPADGKPPHGCPVRAAGTDVIAGIATALFARNNLKRERRFVISYDA
jgi:deferrochelatase/peroxidase EfeB